MSCSCFGTSISSRKKGEAHAHQDLEGHSLGNTRNFSYNELRKATENFHPSNKIGRGGFGTVYKVVIAFKGSLLGAMVKAQSSKLEVRSNRVVQNMPKGILKNGTQVAVKTLSAESMQGVREFLTEIEAISNVRHPNLVELIGCCAHGPNRILVYEYLENNSLDSALLGTKRTLKLDWGRRSAICMGTARGLAYLHEELEPHIVHRDVKASNILLDKDFRPKIGDFGLAKLFPDSITHITTRIAGTTGYLAPEYVMGGQLTLKADVYSFGILILEVVSGRNNAKENWGGMQKLLLEWAWELYEKGKLLELVDPELEQFPEEEVIKYIKVAFFCTQSAASRRPMMSQVVEMLSRDIRLNEKELTAPGFSADSGGPSGVSYLNKKSPESSTSGQMSSVPITITQVTPR